MTSISLTTSQSPLLLIKPPLLQPKFRAKNLNPKLNQRRKNRSFICRAEFSQDAPFALAIGGCILNSLVFPVSNGPDEDSDGGSPIDSTDARFAVMGIISFIPYFNWLSWIFAWLDTGKQRYAVYSIVYLAPYIRTNLSLSTEESWLPIASIVFCIIHIQLEASIRNGDLQGFQLFNQLTQKKDVHFEDLRGSPKEGRKKDQMGLPSAQKQSRDELRGWGEVRRKPLDEPENLNEDEGDMKNRKKD